MKIKTCLRALYEKAHKNRRLRKKLTKSYVSLFLIMVLMVGTTSAWFVLYDNAIITSGNLELQSASSLRVNKGKQISNNIHIDDFILDEASSVDGRNIYFPVSGSFTTDTLNMIFREGTVGDENVRYVYKDFDLTGTSAMTNVYIKSYKIRVAKNVGTLTSAQRNDDSNYNVYQDELEISYNQSGVPTSQTIPPDCPIRIAFISDSAKTPVVIDPSARVKAYAENSDAVNNISDTGKASVTTTDSDSFLSYYYRTGSPVFSIEGNKQTTVTMVVWLEGTLEHNSKGQAINLNDYIGHEISVDVDIESNFVDMETVTFVDSTVGDDGSSNPNWIANGNAIIAMSYKDPYSSENRYKTVIMTKTDTYEWQAPLPKKAVTGISFYRLSPPNESDVDQGTVFNSWHTYTGVNSQLSSTAQGWRDSTINNGQLQESRTLTDSNNKTYNSTVYTAIRGNGYGDVSHSASDRFEKWLSPCIGYWGYTGSGGSGGGSSGGGGESGGGGGSSSGTYSVSVYVNTGQKNWPEQNANSGSVMHIHFSDGSDFAMTHTGSNRFEKSDMTIAKDVTIDYFYMQHQSGRTNIPVTKEIAITKNFNYTYDLNNEDKLVPNA